MKKLNLLLATTAVLSMGALAVNAANPTDTIKASVDLISGDSINATQDIYFGAWKIDGTTTEFTLEMDQSGLVTSGDEDVIKLTNSQYGLVSGAPCELLSFTGETDLDFGDSQCSRHITLDNITAVKATASDNLTCKVIADVHYDDVDCGGGHMFGTHTFDLTVTALLGLEDQANP